MKSDIVWVDIKWTLVNINDNSINEIEQKFQGLPLAVITVVAFETFL